MICGDFNSDAIHGGFVDDTPTVDLFEAAGYAEAWPATPPQQRSRAHLAVFPRGPVPRWRPSAALLRGFGAIRANRPLLLERHGRRQLGPGARTGPGLVHAAPVRNAAIWVRPRRCDRSLSSMTIRESLTFARTERAGHRPLCFPLEPLVRAGSEPGDVGQPSGHGFSRRRTGRGASTCRPSAPRETPRARSRGSRRGTSSLPRSAFSTRGRPRAPTSERLRRDAWSSATASRGSVTHGRPIATEFPKKISENDSPTTAWMPARASACGACSREDPQPKLRFTRRMRAPEKRASSKGCVSPFAFARPSGRPRTRARRAPRT